MEKIIKLQQEPGPLGGISLRWSHHTNLIGYGDTLSKAFDSLKSVYSWEKVPFPQVNLEDAIVIGTA